MVACPLATLDSIPDSREKLEVVSKFESDVAKLQIDTLYPNPFSINFDEIWSKLS